MHLQMKHLKAFSESDRCAAHSYMHLVLSVSKHKLSFLQDASSDVLKVWVKRFLWVTLKNIKCYTFFIFRIVLVCVERTMWRPVINNWLREGIILILYTITFCMVLNFKIRLNWVGPLEIRFLRYCIKFEGIMKSLLRHYKKCGTSGGCHKICLRTV